MPKQSASKEPPRFSNLYVFGDSLADIGNAYQATGGILAAPPNGDRRFADELIWVDYLADYLWLSCQIYSKMRSGEGVNFATGGATTGTENLYPATVANLPELPGLQPQIQAFTRSLKRKKGADPDALYIISAGMMDYLPWINDNPQQTEPTEPMSHIVNAAKTLVQAGAKHVMLVNVPDVSKTPLVAQSACNASDMSKTIAAHNQALADFVKMPLLNVNWIGFDVCSVLDEIIRDARYFGFRNTTDACSHHPERSPKDHIFWDMIHPTSKVHHLIARAALETLCEATTLRLVTSCPLG